MERVTQSWRALVLVSVCAAASCSNGSYTVVLRFDAPADPSQARRVEVTLVPSCNAQTLGDPPVSALHTLELTPDSRGRGLGAVKPGTYGLYARAFDASCGVVAAGCRMETLEAGGSGDLLVLLDPASGPRECTAAMCVDGTCIAPDAGGGPLEAGPIDGGAMDAGPTDAGPADGGAGDAGPCSPGVASCTGDVLTRCTTGARVRTDCTSMNAYCGVTGAGPGCVPWVCTPGTARCAASATTSYLCDARGSSEMPTACPYGCNPVTGVCSPMTACPLSFIDVDLGSTEMFSACMDTNDFTEVHTTDCSADGNGPDRLFRLTLTRTTDVDLDVQDNDMLAQIDTLLYVRTTCDDQSSQVACDDNVACASSYDRTNCVAGIQPREARIQTTLGPGTYYIVVDLVEHGPWTCGMVLLTVNGTPAP